MKKLALLAAVLPVLAALTACDNDTDPTTQPGSSLVSDNVSILIDDDFTLEARSMANGRIQSRTTTMLLGSIRAPEYGALRADYAAQMFPSNALDTAGLTAASIDSVKLQMVFAKGGFVGDSLAPIGVEVYRLAGKLPYPIYSDTPADGLYDSDGRMGSTVFTAAGIGVNDTVAGAAYRYAYVKLPLQWGRDLFNKYKADPLLFNDPEAFAGWFPGFYVRHSYGSGRVTRISDTRVIMYYHKVRDLTNSEGVVVKDSLTRHYAYYMASAPEVVSNTFIDMEVGAPLSRLIADGHQVVVSPAGYDVELRFPIEAAMARYRAQTGSSISVLNNLSFSIPADSIPNGRGISVPPYLLMVLSKEKESFFANNKLPDNVTSFLGTYSADSCRYDFTDLRGYMADMLEKTGADPTAQLKAEDYTFTLTPVAMVTESSGSYYGSTSTTLSGITPMVTLPAMVDLRTSKAKITLTFSRQLLK